MHKLILSFKGRILKVFIPESERCSIGRQADCDIQIDNLAVAPLHARIHFHGQHVRMDLEDPENHVLINNKVTESKSDITLARGDEITIGKHLLTYQWEDSIWNNTIHDEAEKITQKIITPPALNGWLQILSGSKMGRTMPLDKSRFRIGGTSSKGAIITHRDDGYYLSALDTHCAVKLNNDCIDDSSVILKDGNTIQVGDTEMLFFIQD